MTACEPWRVTADDADKDVFAVVGAYKVAGGLPIEDANLIAAAPDLEAALSALVRDVLEYEKANDLHPSPGRSYCWQSVEHALAALAKARGETT